MYQSFTRCIAVLSLSLLAGLSSAFAEETANKTGTPFGERFMLSLGAYVPRLDTTVQVGDNQGEFGTRIDFESNFGMSKNKTLPQLRASWQIARKHRLDFSAFSLKRDGNQTSSVNI